MFDTFLAATLATQGPMPHLTLPEAGVVAAVLIFLKYVLDWVKHVLFKRSGDGEHNRRAPAVLKCEQNEHISGIVTSLEKMEEGILRGDFSCLWGDQEKVTRFIVLQEQMVDGLAKAVTAIDGLTTEVRLTRQNGNGRPRNGK